MNTALTPVKELIYIIGGLCLSHIFLGLFKLFNTLIRSKSISPTHALYSIASPFVIWQFIYFKTVQLDAIEGKIHIDAFIFSSLIIVLNLFFYVGANMILFPLENHRYYTLENRNFRSHLFKSRRFFYFLMGVYIIGTTINNDLAGVPTNSWIRFYRFIIAFFSFSGAFLDFETHKIEFETNKLNKSYKKATQIFFRFPKLKITRSNRGFDLAKSNPLVFKLIRVISKCSDFEIESIKKCNFIRHQLDKKEKIMGIIDFSIAVIIILSFVAITLSRTFEPK